MINSVTLSLYNNICESNQKKRFSYPSFQGVRKKCTEGYICFDYTKDF